MGFFSALSAAFTGGGIESAASIAIAERQMAFQERMSNTAYQRSMKDMRKAGLNPMLAARLGGATTPPGAAGTVGLDIPEGMQAAAAGESAKASTRGSKAQKKQANSAQMLMAEQQQTERAKQALSNSQRDRVNLENIPLEIQSAFDLTPAGRKAIQIRRLTERTPSVVTAAGQAAAFAYGKKEEFKAQAARAVRNANEFRPPPNKRNAGGKIFRRR